MTDNEDEGKLKLQNAYQRAMRRATKKKNDKLIKAKDYDKELCRLYMDELAKDVMDIRASSRITYLKGIVSGASFGILGSFSATAIFRYLDNPNYGTLVLFIIPFLATFGLLAWISGELEKLVKGKKV